MKKQAFFSGFMLILILTVNLLQGWLGLAVPYCQQERAVFSTAHSAIPHTCHYDATSRCCDHTPQVKFKTNSTEIHLDCVHCLNLHLQTSIILFNLFALIGSLLLRRHRFSFPAIHFRSHIPERLSRPPHSLFSHV